PTVAAGSPNTSRSRTSSACRTTPTTATRTRWTRKRSTSSDRASRVATLATREGSTRHGAHAVMDFHGACCTVGADLLPGGNMHRARQHAETRTRERRRRLAHEAARLMAEGGIRDYHQAK